MKSGWIPSATALKQIEGQNYIAALNRYRVKEIWIYGIAFCDKRVPGGCKAHGLNPKLPKIQIDDHSEVVNMCEAIQGMIDDGVKSESVKQRYG